MMKQYDGRQIEDVRVKGYTTLISPNKLKDRVSSQDSSQTVENGRSALVNLLKGSNRLAIIAGPCSIHDEKAAVDYAERLAALRLVVGDNLELFMRAYFEKPRTSVGWKGLLYEPNLDGVGNINEGLSATRKILRKITQLNVPVSTEFLDPIVPQYIDDFISCGSIGARTVESPQHRQMVSGLSMPVGLKNTLTGDVSPAINAILASRYDGHVFFGLTNDGETAIVSTYGNPDTFLILRGGDKSPNYDSESIDSALNKLGAAGLDQKLMIDCSHGNSKKKAENQHVAFENVLGQIRDGKKGIIGLMLESNLSSGNQPLSGNLQYGVSITDECIGWEETERLILQANRILTSTSVSVR